MSGALFRAEDYDEDGSGPLYLRLVRVIDEAIDAGALKPGESLPAERELAALTGLSRVTVRKAVATLVQAGRLANPSLGFGRMSGHGETEIERSVMFDSCDLAMCLSRTGWAGCSTPPRPRSTARP